MKDKTGKYFLLVLLFDGYIFLASGWEKVTAGTFVSGLSKTLGFLTSKNPYPWFKDFLLATAIPNASLLGLLVEMGELFAGLTLVIGAIYLFFVQKITLAFKVWITLGALTGGALSLVFYLAAGWTSPSTSSLNLIMLVVELVAVIFIWSLPVEKKTIFS